MLSVTKEGLVGSIAWLVFRELAWARFSFSSYEPLNITTWRRAMVMMLKGKAEVSRIHREIGVAPSSDRYPLTATSGCLPSVAADRRNLFHRDNHSCQYCGCRNEPLSIDHVVPRSVVVTPGKT